jgi:hypothetical protein
MSSSIFRSNWMENALALASCSLRTPIQLIVWSWAPFSSLKAARSHAPRQLRVMLEYAIATLAGIKAGATHASVTVIGLGERAGNAPLEEVAVASAPPPCKSASTKSLRSAKLWTKASLSSAPTAAA